VGSKLEGKFVNQSFAWSQ